MTGFGTYLSLGDGCVWDPFGLFLVPSQGFSVLETRSIARLSVGRYRDRCSRVRT